MSKKGDRRLAARLLRSAKATRDGALSDQEQRLLAIASALFTPALAQAATQLNVQDLATAPDQLYLVAARKALQMAAAVDDPLRELRQAMEDS